MLYLGYGIIHDGNVNKERRREMMEAFEMQKQSAKTGCIKQDRRKEKELNNTLYKK